MRDQSIAVICINPRDWGNWPRIRLFFSCVILTVHSESVDQDPKFIVQ